MNNLTEKEKEVEVLSRVLEIICILIDIKVPRDNITQLALRMIALSLDFNGDSLTTET